MNEFHYCDSCGGSYSYDEEKDEKIYANDEALKTLRKLVEVYEEALKAILTTYSNAHHHDIASAALSKRAEIEGEK